MSNAPEWLIDPASLLDVNLCCVYTARLKNGTLQLFFTDKLNWA
jgi:hypothetical protein